MSDAPESCNMWIGLTPNSNTKVTPRKQGDLALNKWFVNFKKGVNNTCGEGGL